MSQIRDTIYFIFHNNESEAFKNRRSETEHL